MNTRLKLVLAAALIALIGIVEAVMVIHGMLPFEKVETEIVTPLYPYNFTYVECFRANLGRGSYTLVASLQQSTRTVLVIIAYKDGHAYVLRRIVEGEDRVSFYSDFSPIICVAGYAERYQTRMCRIEVVRR